MRPLSFRQRQADIQRLQNEVFDVLIIGGGITGAGIAVQAAANGLKTALIEMQDFAEGTSSRSTKLVHGGIRYFKQFDIEVVSETVQERAVVQQIAPHIPRPQKMLLPVYDEPKATFSLIELETAMNLYDSLAGVADSEFSNELLTKEQVLEKEADIMSENLIGGGFYLDYINNDARLVIENIKQAHEDGAVVLNRAKLNAFDYDAEGSLKAARVKDLVDDSEFTIQAHQIINATGPWSDTVRKLDQEDDFNEIMRPTKGVHLVVDRARLAVNSPVYFDSGDSDGRMIFVLPRANKTYFGTTDTDYDGDLANPQVEQADVDYLLKIVNRRFPKAQLTINDIEASWAGLRPLISGSTAGDYNGASQDEISDEQFDLLVDLFQQYFKEEISRPKVEQALKKIAAKKAAGSASPSQVSRGSDLLVSESGLISIVGGKLTDYRKMAEGVMDELVKKIDRCDPSKLIDSKTYQVSGGHFDYTKVDQTLLEFAKAYEDKGLSNTDARYLAELYGSNYNQVLEQFELAQEYSKKFDLPLKDSLSLIYALTYEGVLTSEDYFIRRTNYMLFMAHEMRDIIGPVQEVIADYLDLSDEEYEKQANQLAKAIRKYSLADFKK